MKKRLFALLVASLCFIAVACDDNDDDSSKENDICADMMCSECRDAPEGGSIDNIKPTKVDECCACNYKCDDENKVIDKTEWKCVDKSAGDKSDDKADDDICANMMCSECRDAPAGGSIDNIKPTKVDECCACNYKCDDENKVIDETAWKCVDKSNS